MRFGILKIAILMMVCCVVADSTLAQSRPKIEIYTAADSRRTAKELKHKLKSDDKNASLWNQLGLELMYQQEFRDAISAFTTAVSLEPSNPDYLSSLKFSYLRSKSPSKIQKSATKAIEKDPSDANAYLRRAITYLNEGKSDEALRDIDSAITYNSEFSAAYAFKADIYLSKFEKGRSQRVTAASLDHLKASLNVLEKCLVVCDVEKTVLAKAIDERLRFIAYFDTSIIFEGAEDAEPDSPLKLHSKPPPGYTNSARRLNITGSVRLVVMFNPDNTIGQILVLEGLPGGLVTNAVEAAKKIKFEAERKDGESISVVKTIAYRFSLY